MLHDLVQPGAAVGQHALVGREQHLGPAIEFLEIGLVDGLVQRGMLQHERIDVLCRRLPAAFQHALVDRRMTERFREVVGGEHVTWIAQHQHHPVVLQVRNGTMGAQGPVVDAARSEQPLHGRRVLEQPPEFRRTRGEPALEVGMQHAVRLAQAFQHAVHEHAGGLVGGEEQDAGPVGHLELPSCEQCPFEPVVQETAPRPVIEPHAHPWPTVLHRIIEPLV